MPPSNHQQQKRSNGAGGGGGGGGGRPPKPQRRSSRGSIPTREEERIIRREGGKILSKMTEDHSAFFGKCRPRVFPTFERGEMGLGRTLGMGTFCRVAEILEIRLRKESTGTEDDGDDDGGSGDGENGEDEERGYANEEEEEGRYGANGRPANYGVGRGGDDADDDDNFEPSLDAAMAAADLPTGHSRARSDHSAHSKVTVEGGPLGDSSAENVQPAFDDADDGGEPGGGEEREDYLDQAGHDGHYNMSPSETRMFMERKCVRRTKSDNGNNGNGGSSAARYAVKRLRPDLNENERINGAIDLAVEARFLSAVYHPNIVKMRGTVGGPDPLSPGFFLVLDRLYDTLEQRMEFWREDRERYSGCCRGLFGADKEELRILMADRLKVCYDVAAVFRYLHSHNLIYRDLKTDNIGFDVRDDVKVFDFGLCKELVPEERTRDGKNYKLTGLTGSFRYMAPEVALSKPYNLSADVYSYGVLVWQLLDLRHPFGDMNMSDYTRKVARGGQRPSYNPRNKWPESTADLARKCWDADPSKRPEFEKIAAKVKNDLLVTSYDHSGSIANRSAHMMTRSQCSGETGSRGSGAAAENHHRRGSSGMKDRRDSSEDCGHSTGSIGSANRLKH